MGISSAVCRSTLADANEMRDWRIYAELAQRLIAQARKLYVGESLAVDLDNTVYALDSTTIDLCLSMFPWANFRTAKAAVKLHTLLDIRGAIPSFIHISDGKLHDVNVLDMLMLEAGAFYVMDRAYLDFQRLYTVHQAGSFFVTRAKSNLDARRVYSAPVDRRTGVVCDQLIVLNGHYSRLSYPEQLRRIRFKVPETGKTLIWFIRLKGTFVKNRDMLLPSEATKHSEQKEAATCLQAYCIMGLEYGDINMCQRNFLQDRLSSLLLRTVLC
jgi:hypothetical protein